MQEIIVQKKRWVKPWDTTKAMIKHNEILNNIGRVVALLDPTANEGIDPDRRVFTKQAACKKLKINHDTYYHWLKQPEYKEYEQKLLAQIYDGVDTQAEMIIGSAINGNMRISDSERVAIAASHLKRVSRRHNVVATDMIENQQMILAPSSILLSLQKFILNIWPQNESELLTISEPLESADQGGEYATYEWRED